ncbi:phosphatidate cytidylyltransferase [Flagellimonas taeanensis]|jgi:phosphatidate cytidylyltransferase|uniref:Phosphatidate cytidylyltransferase n=1 Tax=Flagellimonas taeanensis TaxID=1005926 RepID=A0A3A1NVE8_9FLAO|nr:MULTISPECIES: phosphatidate cytidylyltransferase [Allomuricauda]MDC6384386.1 phosphatidate cytidylyltransferase [Muricauda sp. SK9]MEE1962466.1 phosphatidate cytidylyltransferase [Allomuricauda taeanensis]RIV49735.1 phosphatidate cytidylyltransferase [Allomuricauda taeanensis]RIV53934.1 phosphatidate cytidylyltransferase [Allomuricauda taeanensis]SFC58957.1 phosphatidate cytidylyltransferase [Allomuricauda taeanensis]
MKEILRRSITGVIYVVLLLGAVFLSSDAFDFLFMAFGLACLYEFKRIVKLKGYYIFIAYLALWWIFIYLVRDGALVTLLMLLTITVDLALLAFLFSKRPREFTELQKFIIAVFYIGGGCIFLTMIPYKDDAFAQFLIMGIFILIWVNDTFAYLVGRALGRTKLFPAVSPKKTIEGSVGGLIFALVAAYILSWYETKLSLMEWMAMATLIVVAGSLGDLLESKFKRMAGVKDSGAILPGHGGVWDRLDSLVFASPFAYLILNIFSYVS